MNVKIENPLNDIDEMGNLMHIVSLTKTCDNSFDSLMRMMSFYHEPKNSMLKFGKGGDHIWVSYRNDRILLITRN